MSLFTPPSQQKPPTLTPAQTIAAQQKNAATAARDVLNFANITFNTLLNGINENLAKMWTPPVNPTDPTIQQRLDALHAVALSRGGQATDVFAANTAALAFLERLHPGVSTTIASLPLVKPTTTNADGSVTLT